MNLMTNNSKTTNVCDIFFFYFHLTSKRLFKFRFSLDFVMFMTEKSAQQMCDVCLASLFISFNLKCLNGTINELHQRLKASAGPRALCSLWPVN